MAHGRGLEPLAIALLEGGRQRPAPPPPPLQLAARFVSAPEVPTPADALAGAADIIAEWAAELPEARQRGRQALQRHGCLISSRPRAAKQGAGKDAGRGGGGGDKGSGAGRGSGHQQQSQQQQGVETYALYHDFRCPLRSLRPHQALAVNRGEAQGALAVKLEWDAGDLAPLAQRLLLQRHGEASWRPAGFGQRFTQAL